jgi:RNA polymerase sporulation-specific sigma factor
MFKHPNPAYNHAYFTELGRIEAKIVQLLDTALPTNVPLRKFLIIGDFTDINTHPEYEAVSNLATYHRELYAIIIIYNMHIPKALAHNISKKLRSRANPGDIHSAAILGLIYAIEKFDPSKGTRFDAFAYVVARQRVWDDQMRAGGFCDARYSNPQESHNWVDAIISYESDPTYPREDVTDLMQRLPEDERIVLELRFGIGTDDQEESTLMEVAACLGISHETVRRREKKAVATLRAIAEAS